jgi:hypothetical protein
MYTAEGRQGLAHIVYKRHHFDTLAAERRARDIKPKRLLFVFCGMHMQRVSLGFRMSESVLEGGGWREREGQKICLDRFFEALM